MSFVTTSTMGVMPKQAVEWSDDDYIKTLRFIASMWNRPLYNYSTSNAQQPLVNTDDSRYVYSYVQNLTYVFGRQTLSEYGFFVKDELGQQTKFPMFRGMDVAKIYRHVHGTMEYMIKPIPKTINVSAYSKNVLSSKKMMMNMIAMKAKYKALFDIIKEVSGYEFSPIDKDFESQEELDAFLQDFQETMEIAYQNLAKHVTIFNDYDINLPKVADYVFIGGTGQIEVYHHNGRIKWNVIPPESSIIDMSKNDDQHRYDDYGGAIVSMTVPELVTAYDWTPEEVKELESIAAASSQWGTYNSFIGVNGLYWWSINNGVPKVTVVKAQWRSMQFVEGEWIECLREGALIGNKWLKNNYISDTQIWDKKDPSRRRLRFISVSPDTLLGNNMGIVGMLKRYQDLKDAYTTKMVELSSRAIGKSYVVNASKLPEGMTTPDVISQLKQANIIVLEGADIDDNNKGKGLVEPIDLTLDPNVKYYLDMIQYYDNVMSDIINIPLQSRGFQANATYQSKEVVATNNAQSTLGMNFYYNNLMKFIERVIEYSADLAKLVMPKEDEEQLALIVGDAAVELMQMETFREMRFEDFLLTLDPTGVFDEADKAQLQQLAMALAQNGAITMSEFIKLKQLENKDEAYSYFQSIELRKKREAEMQQQQQMQLQQEQMALQDRMNQRQVDANIVANDQKAQAEQQPPPPPEGQAIQ